MTARAEEMVEEWWDDNIYVSAHCYHLYETDRDVSINSLKQLVNQILIDSTEPKEEKMLTTEDSTGNKEGQTKPTISPDNAYINKLPEKVNFMIGWKCPNCGAGLSPYASRCGCVDKYVITC